MSAYIMPVIIAIIGSGAFTTLINYYINRHTRKDEYIQKMEEQIQLCTETLAAVSYWVLATQLEKMIQQGYATVEERKMVSILYKPYKANGWNGDMDSLMELVHKLPIEPLRIEE